MSEEKKDIVVEVETGLLEKVCLFITTACAVSVAGLIFFDRFR